MDHAISDVGSNVTLKGTIGARNVDNYLILPREPGKSQLHLMPITLPTSGRRRDTVGIEGTHVTYDVHKWCPIGASKCASVWRDR
jgi:hypothetical protein